MAATDFQEHEPYLTMGDHMTNENKRCGRTTSGYECTRPKGHTGYCEAGNSWGAVASWTYG